MKCIAIDGPSGAGKSTIAKNIAKKLGYIYVDTGALYRSIALYLISNNINIENRDDIINSLPNINITINFIDNEQRVYLNLIDVTNKIRTPEISIATAKISSIPCVRDFLLKIQNDISKSSNIIMDGRDIGTVVLPNADIKIFLTATVEERAKRRYNQLIKHNIDTTYEEVLEDIKLRDNFDYNRKVSPLKQAEDSIFVETTGNELKTSIEIITKIIKERI